MLCCVDGPPPPPSAVLCDVIKKRNQPNGVCVFSFKLLTAIGPM